MAVSAPTASRRAAREQDDRAVAQRAGDGDEAAFAELYDRHAPGLLAFVQQYVGDRGSAEDVVQQTFLGAYRTLSGGTELQHPRAWLYHVARNTALTVVRDRRSTDAEAELAEELHDRAAAIPTQVEQREALREVVRDIVALPAEQRAALALFEIGDLSQAEIAQVLGCSPARVKALVFQARAALVTQREARGTSCVIVREKLATFHGGALNHRLIRHHLRSCEPCTAYRDELRDRRRKLALILPVLPAPGVREAVLGMFGGGAAHTGGAGAAAGAHALRSARVARGHTRWLVAGGAAAVAAVWATVLAWPSGQHRRDLPARSAGSVAARPAHGAMTLPPAAAGSAAAAASSAARAAAGRPSGAAGARGSRPAAAQAGAQRSSHPGTSGASDRATSGASRRGTTGSPLRGTLGSSRPGGSHPGARRAPRPTPPRGSRPRPGAPRPAAPGAPRPPQPRAPSPAPPTAPPASAGTSPAAAAPAASPQPAPSPQPIATPQAAPPAAPCLDHSHASEQGLEHGKGHHKCKGA